MKRLLIMLFITGLCLSMVACSSGKKVVTGYDGTPALNLDTVNKHITRVELTVDNWRNYIKEYSYDVEIVEKDAFGEIIKAENVTIYRLGYGTEKYYCLSATIELKHKQTGEIVTFGENLPTNIVKDICAVQYEPFQLNEYECTRIAGYMYFIDYSDEVMKEVLDIHDRRYAEEANAQIVISCSVFEGIWNVDCDAKVIESNTDNWNKYFE